MIDWIQVNMSCSFLFWTYLTIPTLSHAVGIQIPRFRVREGLRKGFAQRRRSCCQVDEWIIPPDQCPMFKLQPNRFIIFNILYTLIIFYEFVNFFPFQPRLSSPFPTCGRFGVWQRVIRSQEADPPGGPGHRTNDFKKWHDDTTPQIPSEISECHSMLDAKEKCMEVLHMFTWILFHFSIHIISIWSSFEYILSLYTSKMRVYTVYT